MWRSSRSATKRALPSECATPGRACLKVRWGADSGTQIVRTLIQGELGGTIDWHTIMGSGTEVTIDIPLRYIDRDVN